MNDIRILIPWHELSEDAIETINGRASKADAYNAHLVIQTWATRPITPEDIRSCLRMPREWTDAERDKLVQWVCTPAKSEHEVANLVIEIATRHAPKLDPWEEMDRFVKDTDGWGDTRLSMIWEELKKTEGK